MPVNHRKLKYSKLELDGDEYQSQLTDFTLDNGTDNPEILHTYGGDEDDFAEEAEPSWTLKLKFYSDWRAAGVSDFLTAHDGETVDFLLTHHADIAGEAHTRGGQVYIKAPSVGGEVRSTEITEVELAVIGKPDYTRL